MVGFDPAATEAPREPADPLVEAAMGGDRAAIQTIWRNNRRWVAAVLLSYKPRRAEVEDLLQDVAMTVVRKVHTVRDPAHFRAWLRTVAINTARAAARGPAGPMAVSDLDGHSSGVSAQGGFSLDREEERKRVAVLVAALPDTYREPLLLRAVHGLKSREIASIMGIPEPTVDTRVARARRMLREMSETEAAAAGSEGEVDKWNTT